MEFLKLISKKFYGINFPLVDVHDEIFVFENIF